MRSLGACRADALGIDVKATPFTHLTGSITDRGFVRRCMGGVRAVLHTATLHKPHIATHSRQDFIDTNVTGTLNLLEEAVTEGVQSFVFTSSTSVFGRALVPPAGAAAAWITEHVTPLPKNIYGVSKIAAEHLCEFFHLKTGLPCIILRTSRFFPEEDDDISQRQRYADLNLKVNEFLYRRADLADVVSAHMLALQRAADLKFGRYIISATTPFTEDDLQELRIDAAAAARRRVPSCEAEYARRGWQMPVSIDRVYVNERARTQLGWRPQYDFAAIIRRLSASEDFRSPLARAVGSRGYHAESFAEGPYPTDDDLRDAMRQPVDR